MRTLYQTISAGADQKAELSLNGSKQYKKSGKKIRHVKSGIALAGLDGKTLPSGEQGGFLASRTFRVLLAGAGFLADAVRTYFLSPSHFPSLMPTISFLSILIIPLVGSLLTVRSICHQSGFAFAEGRIPGIHCQWSNQSIAGHRGVCCTLWSNLWAIDRWITG